MDITVSVIMTTYNQDKYLTEAMAGVINQKCNFPIELIISNDNSPDGTDELVKDFLLNRVDDQFSIRYYRHAKNKGAIKNLAWCLKQAKGKYIAICEGDDYWSDNNKLKKQVKFLESNYDYGLIFSDIDLTDNKGSVIILNESYDEVKVLYKSGFVFWNLLERNFINTLTICGRKNIFIEYLNQFPNEYYAYDLRYWLYFSLRTKVKYLNEKSAVYRIHEQGISRNKSFFLEKKPRVIMSAIIDYLTNTKGLVDFNVRVFSEQVYKLLFNKNLSIKEKNRLIQLLLRNPYYMFLFLKTIIYRIIISIFVFVRTKTNLF